MPADKLGRFMTSGTFLARANAAVTTAVRRLEMRGITPAYIQRQQSQQSKAGAGPGHSPQEASSDVPRQHESPRSK
ncbi:hypothetical protein CJO79_03640 [Ralstonia solanacearum]|nr:hypothetical protein CJO76_03650 [Ralstonia solanacearum]AXV90141.1 hypothetical protein CJO79_03640 [Ralstonia solanacearum]AXW18337.1 hypothetical protein CJO85_03685 [Ralstonia solanacearum]AXW75051.1 hypothetical protein CJO97_03650 [Ralstonia solanacearum]